MVKSPQDVVEEKMDDLGANKPIKRVVRDRINEKMGVRLNPRVREIEKLEDIADEAGIPKEEQKPDTGVIGRVLELFGTIEYAGAGALDEVIKDMSPEDKAKVRVGFEFLNYTPTMAGPLATGGMKNIGGALISQVKKDPIGTVGSAGKGFLKGVGQGVGGILDLVSNIPDAPGKLVNLGFRLADSPGTPATLAAQLGIHKLTGGRTADAMEKGRVIPEIIPDRLLTKGDPLDFEQIQRDLGVSKGIVASDVLPFIPKGSPIDEVVNSRMRTSIALGLITEGPFIAKGMLRNAGTVVLKKGGKTIGKRQMTRAGAAEHVARTQKALGFELTPVKGGVKVGPQNLDKAADEVKEALYKNLGDEAVPIDDLDDPELFDWLNTSEQGGMAKAEMWEAARDVADDKISKMHWDDKKVNGKKLLANRAMPRWAVDQLGEGGAYALSTLADSSNPTIRRIGEALIDSKDMADTLLNNFKASIADNELYNEAFEVHQATLANLLKNQEDEIGAIFHNLSKAERALVSRAFYEDVDALAKIKGMDAESNVNRALESTRGYFNQIARREKDYRFNSGGGIAEGRVAREAAPKQPTRTNASNLDGIDETLENAQESAQEVVEGFDVNNSRPMYFNNDADDVVDRLSGHARRADRAVDTSNIKFEGKSKYGRVSVRNDALDRLAPHVVHRQKGTKLKPITDIREVMRRFSKEHIEELMDKSWREQVVGMFNISDVGVDTRRLFRGLDHTRRFGKRILTSKEADSVDEAAKVYGKSDKKLFKKKFTKLTKAAKTDLLKKIIKEAKSEEDLIAVFDEFWEESAEAFPKFRTLAARKKYTEGGVGIVKIAGEEHRVPINIYRDLSKLPPESIINNKALGKSLKAWDAITNSFKTMVTSAALAPTAFGATAGGAYGAATAEEGERLKGAAIGAAAGAAAGAGVRPIAKAAKVRSLKKDIPKSTKSLSEAIDDAKITKEASEYAEDIVAPLFPSFHFRNFAFGNTVQSFMEAGVSVLNPRRMLKHSPDILNGKEGKIITDAGEEVSYQQLRREIGMGKPLEVDPMLGRQPTQLDIIARGDATLGQTESLGVVQEASNLFEMVGDATPFSDSALDSKVLEYVGKSKDYVRKLKTKGQNVGSKIENIGRMNLYLTKRIQGASPKEAAAAVQRALFNYASLSDVEKNVARRLVPFWTYNRKILPLVIDTMLDKPGRVLVQAKLVRSQQRDDAPVWMSQGDRITLSSDGGNLYQLDGVDLPIASLKLLDPFLYPLGIAGDPAKAIKGKEALRSNWISMMHPVAKRFAELGLDKEAFTGRDTDIPKELRVLGMMVAELPKEIKDFVGYQPRVDKKTGRIKHEFDPHKLWIVTDAFAMSRILYSPDKVFEKKTEDIQFGKFALKWLTGLSLEEVPKDEVMRLRREERIRFLNERLQRSGDIKQYGVSVKSKDKKLDQQ
jgi:hypothetical protein